MTAKRNLFLPHPYIIAYQKKKTSISEVFRRENRSKKCLDKVFKICRVLVFWLFIRCQKEDHPEMSLLRISLFRVVYKTTTTQKAEDAE